MGLWSPQVSQSLNIIPQPQSSASSLKFVAHSLVTVVNHQCLEHTKHFRLFLTRRLRTSWPWKNIFDMKIMLRRRSIVKRLSLIYDIECRAAWGSPDETNFASTCLTAKANLLRCIEQVPAPRPAYELWRPENFQDLVAKAGFEKMVLRCSHFLI